MFNRTNDRKTEQPIVLRPGDMLGLPSLFSATGKEDEREELRELRIKESRKVINLHYHEDKKIKVSDLETKKIEYNCAEKLIN